MTKHDGCAYSTAECLNQGCKPAELCPAGYQVYRNWTGGGHHHEETSVTPNVGALTFVSGPDIRLIRQQGER